MNFPGSWFDICNALQIAQSQNRAIAQFFSMPIRQITIVGTGLIGGSFALAMRKCWFAGRIVGCDRESALKKAKMRGVIDNVGANVNRQ